MCRQVPATAQTNAIRTDESSNQIKVDRFIKRLVSKSHCWEDAKKLVVSAMQELMTMTMITTSSSKNTDRNYI
jgi:hypothetical protein